VNVYRNAVSSVHIRGFSRPTYAVNSTVFVLADRGNVSVYPMSPVCVCLCDVGALCLNA